MLQGGLTENSGLRGFVVAISLAFVSGLLVGHLSRPNKNDIVEQYFSLIPTMSSCIEELFAPSSRQTVSVGFDEVSKLCYPHIHLQGLLTDFLLRRSQFLQQNYADNMVLWMVVILTMSGVLLAALQLGASYKLTAAGRQNGINDNHEISIEQGRLVLKSSIAGVIILLISFAFFYVFIIHVYHIKAVSLENDELSANQPHQALDMKSNQSFSIGEKLGGGALGHILNTESLSSKNAPVVQRPLRASSGDGAAPRTAVGSGR